jgi:hypothetical protein
VQETICLELLQGVANRLAAYAEVPDQVQLARESITRTQATRANHLTEGPCELGVEWHATACLQHHVVEDAQGRGGLHKFADVRTFAANNWSIVGGAPAAILTRRKSAEQE